MEPKHIVAANFEDITKDWQVSNVVTEVSKRTDGALSTGTVQRIRRAEVDTGMDKLGLLASALSVEVWELLVPPDRRRQLRNLYDALARETAAPKRGPILQVHSADTSETGAVRGQGPLDEEVLASRKGKAKDVRHRN